MKRKKMWRYYCEFCKKSSGSGGAMSTHEKHCTANPNRTCRMCGMAPDIDVHIKALGDGLKPGIERLQEAANDCPACMLAAIRQSKIQYPPDDESPGFYVDWDYQKAKENYWSCVND